MNQIQIQLNRVRSVWYLKHINSTYIKNDLTDKLTGHEDQKWPKNKQTNKRLNGSIYKVCCSSLIRERGIEAPCWWWQRDACSVLCFSKCLVRSRMRVGVLLRITGWKHLFGARSQYIFWYTFFGTTSCPSGIINDPWSNFTYWGKFILWGLFLGNCFDGPLFWNPSQKNVSLDWFGWVMFALCPFVMAKDLHRTWQ